MRTPRLSVVDWTYAPADLNGLVRFVERRNLVSARVPSHIKRSLKGVRYRGVRQTGSMVSSEGNEQAARGVSDSRACCE